MAGSFDNEEVLEKQIEAYSPSQESLEHQEFFGRRNLRIINGQDPEEMPHKFTPRPSMKMEWPTNEEAYAWAEKAVHNKRKRQLFEENPPDKKLTSPDACARASSSPHTAFCQQQSVQPAEVDAVPCALDRM